MPEDMASAFLGLDGVRVTAVEDDLDDGLRVYIASTAARPACPGCGTPSVAVKEWVTARPKDVAFGARAVSLVWFKRRLYCTDGLCGAGSFTESVPAVPPRCRVTARLRGHAAGLVADGGRTVAQAARECGLSWPVVHEAFAARADPVLAQPPSPVAHLGIDEHRRGRPAGAPALTPGSTCSWRIAGTRASLTCPGIRRCWARCRAAPPMTQRTGWPSAPRRGGMPSRSSPLTCAPSTPRRCAGCCQAPGLWWICSTWSSWP